MDLEAYIRDIPDFPKEGIVFKDITPLLASPEGFRKAIDMLAEPYRGRGGHEGARRRGARLHPRRRARVRARRGLRSRPQARQAAVEHDERRVRARVRHRHAGDAHGRGGSPGTSCSSSTTCSRPVGPRPPRPNSSTTLGADGRRLRVPDRAGFPRRTCEARGRARRVADPRRVTGGSLLLDHLDELSLDRLDAAEPEGAGSASR